MGQEGDGPQRRQIGVDGPRIERFGIEAPIGFIMTFDDPDGLQLRFYTLNEVGADPEGRVRVKRS